MIFSVGMCTFLCERSKSWKSANNILRFVNCSTTNLLVSQILRLSDQPECMNLWVALLQFRNHRFKVT
jgi:macrodomain Ter protein organizer (MatP/YcbG family)